VDLLCRSEVPNKSLLGCKELSELSGIGTKIETSSVLTAFCFLGKQGLLSASDLHWLWLSQAPCTTEVVGALLWLCNDLDVDAPFATGTVSMPSSQPPLSASAKPVL
jgi:hypothetical protein